MKSRTGAVQPLKRGQRGEVEWSTSEEIVAEIPAVRRKRTGPVEKLQKQGSAYRSWRFRSWLIQGRTSVRRLSATPLEKTDTKRRAGWAPYNDTNGKLPMADMLSMGFPLSRLMGDEDATVFSKNGCVQPAQLRGDRKVPGDETVA